jgi:hypothetical protein
MFAFAKEQAFSVIIHLYTELVQKWSKIVYNKATFGPIFYKDE